MQTLCVHVPKVNRSVVTVVILALNFVECHRWSQFKPGLG